MDLMFPMLLLFPIGAGAVLLVHRIWTSDVPLRPATALDKAGAVTNWILGIMYLPLSLFFFLLGGMSSEIFMEDRSVVRDALCYVLSIMSIFTFFISEGGILASIHLRRRGDSRKSFAVQFVGLAYFGVMFLLIALLYFM